MNKISNCIATQELIVNKDICTKNDYSSAISNKNYLSEINPFDFATSSSTTPLSGKLLMNVSSVFSNDEITMQHSPKKVLT